MINKFQVIGGLMRYSYEQLGTGNVSQERIQEVVLQMLFKMAEQEVSQAAILRMVNHLLINLEKLILFKKIEQFEQDDIKKFNQQITENKESFIARELRKVKKAIQLHESIMHLISAAISFNKVESRYIHKLYLALKRLQVQLQNDSLEQLGSEQFNKLLFSNSESAQKTESLVIISAHYRKLLAGHRAQIVSARKFYVQRAIENVSALPTAIPLLREMLMPMQANFIDEYFTIKECETIETTKLEQKIQEEINKKSAHSQRAKEQGHFMTHFYLQSSKPTLNQWLAEKKHIKALTLQKVKVLGDKNKNQHINTTITDEVCHNKMAEFENHPAIKDPLTKHLALTKQQTIFIHQKEKLLAEKEDELTLLKQQLALQSKSESHLDKEALGQALLELDISDLGIDVSELEEITLFNNLHAKSRPRC